MKNAGILLWCWLSLSFSYAQTGVGASVELGIGVAGRGEEASVPVAFSVVGTHQIARILFEVSFPKSLVLFTSAAKGSDADSLEMIIKTELQKKKEEDVLRVELSSDNLLPSGELVELRFNISEEAHANDEFSLGNLVQTVQTLSGEPLEAEGLDGAIVVVGDAVFGCFFYMH